MQEIRDTLVPMYGNLGYKVRHFGTNVRHLGVQGTTSWYRSTTPWKEKTGASVRNERLDANEIAPQELNVSKGGPVAGETHEKYF